MNVNVVPPAHCICCLLLVAVYFFALQQRSIDQESRMLRETLEETTYERRNNGLFLVWFGEDVQT